MDDSSLPRYTIIQLGEYTYQIMDALSKQTWEIVILQGNCEKFIGKLKSDTPYNQTDPNMDLYAQGVNY